MLSEALVGGRGWLLIVACLACKLLVRSRLGVGSLRSRYRKLKDPCLRVCGKYIDVIIAFVSGEREGGHGLIRRCVSFLAQREREHGLA